MYRLLKVGSKSDDLEVGIFMFEYSCGFKKKVVIVYINVEGG